MEKNGRSRVSLKTEFGSKVECTVEHRKTYAVN